MKKIIFAMGLMLGALSLTGCQNDAAQDNDGTVESRKLTITSSGAEVTYEDGTRTVMTGNKSDGFGTVWTQATDKLGVYTDSSETAAPLTNNAEFGIASLSAEGIATFEGDINSDAENRTYDLYAYYPYNAANSGTFDAVAVTLAAEQTMPANGTHDPDNDYMIAVPEQITVTDGEITSTRDNFRFRYMVGFLNLSLKEIATAGADAGVSATDVVQSVMITADDTAVVTGDFTANLADGSTAVRTADNHVTINVPEGVTLGDLDAWAVVAPFASEQLTFLITTATHTIEKTATLGGFSIAAGNIKTFNMTIDDACTITPLGGSDEPITVLSETFDDFTGSKAPTSGSTFYSGDYTKDIPAGLVEEGWTFGAGKAGLGCILVGNTASSLAIDATRYLTTPAFTALGTEPQTLTLTFNAYNFEASGKVLYITALNAGEATVIGGNRPNRVSLGSGTPDWSTIPAGTGLESKFFEVTITGATNMTQIMFDGTQSGCSKFFLDNILVVTKAE